jgi:hypothetical protein
MSFAPCAQPSLFVGAPAPDDPDAPWDEAHASA